MTGSPSADLLVERDGPIATVVFNRPRTRNAITYAMWSDLARVVQGLAKDAGVRALVLRGAGTQAFASGADISEFRENRKVRETSLRYNEATSAAYGALRDCPKPTVAMMATSAFCRCSQERIETVLRSFGEEERADMIEADGKIRVTCEYCSRVYAVAPNDLDQAA